jgi:hypothetical protein
VSETVSEVVSETVSEIVSETVSEVRELARWVRRGTTHARSLQVKP